MAYVEIDAGNYVEVPDDATQAQIKAAVRSAKSALLKEKALDIGSTILRAVGTAADIATGGPQLRAPATMPEAMTQEGAVEGLSVADISQRLMERPTDIGLPYAEALGVMAPEAAAISAPLETEFARSIPQGFIIPALMELSATLHPIKSALAAIRTSSPAKNVSHADAVLDALSKMPDVEPAAAGAVTPPTAAEAPFAGLRFPAAERGVTGHAPVARAIMPETVPPGPPVPPIEPPPTGAGPIGPGGGPPIGPSGQVPRMATATAPPPPQTGVTFAPGEPSPLTPSGVPGAATYGEPPPVLTAPVTGTPNIPQPPPPLPTFRPQTSVELVDTPVNVLTSQAKGTKTILPQPYERSFRPFKVRETPAIEVEGDLPILGTIVADPEPLKLIRRGAPDWRAARLSKLQTTVVERRPPALREPPAREVPPTEPTPAIAEPTPPIAEDIPSRLQTAYSTVSSRLGQRHVPIADVLDEAGLSRAEAEPAIRAAFSSGRATPSEVSRSLGEAATPQRVKDATIYLDRANLHASDIAFEGELPSAAHPTGEPAIPPIETRETRIGRAILPNAVEPPTAVSPTLELPPTGRPVIPTQPAPGAAAGLLTDASKINDSTLGQFIDSIVTRDHLNVTEELMSVLNQHGRDVYQDWLNPAKIGARIKASLQAAGFGRETLQPKLNALMRDYERMYNGILNARPVKLYGGGPSTEELLDLVKRGLNKLNFDGLDGFKQVLRSALITQKAEGFLRNLRQATREAWHTPILQVRNQTSKDAITFFDRMDRLGKTFYKAVADKWYASASDTFNPESATRIGQWLDNPTLKTTGQRIPDELARARHYGLTARELEVARWYKQTYTELLNHYITTRLNFAGVDPQKIVNLASRGADATELAKLTATERECYSLLRRRFSDYLPHIFDNDVILEHLQGELAVANQLLPTADKTQAAKLLRIIDGHNKTIAKLTNSELITYRELPNYLQMNFFKPRKGLEGYAFDAHEAFRTYLSQMVRKTYDEPGAAFLKSNFNKIPLEERPYMTWFARRYLGYDRDKRWDSIAHTVQELEWTRTIGLNPRSAIGNITQRLLTFAEVGPVNAFKGQVRAMSVPGRTRRALGIVGDAENTRLWDASMLDVDIPRVLMAPLSESQAIDRLERIRRATGYLFSTVEEGNRKHAFFSALEKYAHLPEAERIEKAVEIVRKTQFGYGRVHTAKMYSNPIVSTMLQFGQFTLKSAELMGNWLFREGMAGRAKLATYLLMAEGVHFTLNELLDTDISNYVGFGARIGDLFPVLASASRAEWDAVWRHIQVAFTRGTGILPSELPMQGPALQALADLREMPAKGAGWFLRRNVMPVIGARAAQAYESILNGMDGRYPVYSADTGEMMYQLNARQLAQRTIGAKSSYEAKEQMQHRAHVLAEREITERKTLIANALVRGDMDSVARIIRRTRPDQLPLIWPSDEGVKNAINRRNMPRTLRDLVETGNVNIYLEIEK